LGELEREEAMMMESVSKLELQLQDMTSGKVPDRIERKAGNCT
jgi:hypothetical protein